MKKRIITSIFLISFAILYLFVGAIFQEWKGFDVWYMPYAFLTVNSILLGITIFEVMNLRKGESFNWIIKAIIFVFAIILLWFPIAENIKYEPYWNKYDGPSRIEWWQSWMVLLIYMIFLLVILVMVKVFKKFSANDALFIFCMTLYLVFAFKAMNYIMLQPGFGWPAVSVVLLITISNDTFAYIGGTLVGKNALAPKISPSKTWEGAIIGILVTLVLVLGYIVLLTEFTKYQPFANFFTTKTDDYKYVIYFLLILFLSLISHMGDLLFSFIKRNHNVKDFSNVLPGHGGFLDRIDSLSLVLIFTGFFMLIQSFSTI